VTDNWAALAALFYRPAHLAGRHTSLA